MDLRVRSGVSGVGSSWSRQQVPTPFLSKPSMPALAYSHASSWTMNAAPMRTALKRFPSTGPIRAYAPTAANPAVASPAAASPPTTLKYRFMTKQGSVVNVNVVQGAGLATAQISYAPGNWSKHIIWKDVHVKESPLKNAQSATKKNAEPEGTTSKGPLLHWSVYRGTPAKSYHPKEAVPRGSALDEETGVMRSPLAWDGTKKTWCTELLVPAKLLPLQLSLAFFNPVFKTYDEPVHGTSCIVPLGMSSGTAKPLGPSVSAVRCGAGGEQRCDVNVSVYSRDAATMTLCLVRVDPTAAMATAAGSSGAGGRAVTGLTYMEIALDPRTNKTGDLWHMCVHGLKDVATLTYAWKADGKGWSGGGKFHGGYLLLDPYATQAVSVLLPASYWTLANKLPPAPKHDIPVLLGSLEPVQQSSKLLLQSPSSAAPTHLTPVQPSSRVIVEVDVKTFATGPEVAPERQGKLLGVIDRLPLLLEAGATTILLAPIALSADGEYLSMFAPDPSLAVASPLAVAEELKQVVKACHAAGVEVLLELEFCTTGEGSNAVAHSGLQGLHGLGADVYYRRSPDGMAILNVGHPVVRQLVLDCLHHWAMHFGFDGFCILKAENLAQDRNGVIMDSPFLAEEIAYDPILSHLQLIAAPSNSSLLPRNGERGFPHWGVWSQWNSQFVYDMRAYLATNQHGRLSRLATYITGSPDILSPRWDGGLPGGLAMGRSPAASINTVGPLGSTVSLPARLRGGEGQTPSGTDPTPQWNDVLARTLLLSMFASLGVPCLSSATVTSDPALRRFVGLLGVVRKSLAELIAPPLHDSPRQLQWHGVLPGAQPDWSGTSAHAHANCLAFSVRNELGQGVYVGFNPYSEQVVLPLPLPPRGMCWKAVINTGAPPPGDASLPADEGLPVVSNISSSSSKQQVVLAPLAGVLVMAVARPTTSV